MRKQGRPRKPRNYIRTKFVGYQVWRCGRFALYNLLEPMGEHPVNSTVSLNTIKLHGFEPYVEEGVAS